MDAIARQVRDVTSQHRRIVVHAVAAEDPTHVRPPRALTRRVRIAFAVGVLMMDAVRRHPEDRAAFERQRRAPRQDVLDRPVGLVAAVRQQPVVAHADAEHAGDDVKDDGGEDRTRVDKEKGRNGTDMEADHRRGGNPVEALLILASVLQRARRHVGP